MDQSSSCAHSLNEIIKIEYLRPENITREYALAEDNRPSGSTTDGNDLAIQDGIWHSPNLSSVIPKPKGEESL
jgi:hypothetical protein